MFYILDRPTANPCTASRNGPSPRTRGRRPAATQPFPRGEPFVPEQHPSNRRRDPARSLLPDGRIFTPTGTGRPSSSPARGAAATGARLLQPGHGPGLRWLQPDQHCLLQRPERAVGNTAAVRRILAGGLAAVDPRTNTVAWRRPSKWWLSLTATGSCPQPAGCCSRAAPTASSPRWTTMTGEELWTWQCGAGVDTCPIAYEIDGEQYIAILAGGRVGTDRPGRPLRRQSVGVQAGRQRSAGRRADRAVHSQPHYGRRRSPEPPPAIR